MIWLAVIFHYLFCAAVLASGVYVFMNGHPTTGFLLLLGSLLLVPTKMSTGKNSDPDD